MLTLRIRLFDGLGLGAVGELTSVTVERASGRPGQTTTLPPNGMPAPAGGGQDFRFAKI